MKRPPAKAYSRFANHSVAVGPTEVRGLRDDNAAMIEGRTIFPSTVVSSVIAPRLLTKGSNQRKLGDRVTVGPWKGMPIFALTLEERKTCPRSCHLLSRCYGNGMPLARRIAFDDALIPALDAELGELQRLCPRGFVVRLHVLGDFKNLAYVRQWEEWLDVYPALRVFGYTAHPMASRVGREIYRLAQIHWTRFAIRHSVTSETAFSAAQATTISSMPAGPRAASGIICPVLTGTKANCGSCGLCWAPAARDKRIVFVLHGQASRAGRPFTPAAGAARMKTIYEMAVAAAESGAVMPSNQKLADAAGYTRMNEASSAMARLKDQGKISVEVFQTGRIVTITATGKRTATPKDTTPHWRAR